LAYNLSLACQDGFAPDLSMQLLSALCHSLGTGEFSEDVALSLLMALGRLIYKNQESIELVSAFDVNIDRFTQNTESVKLKQAAEEIKLLLQTPVE